MPETKQTLEFADGTTVDGSGSCYNRELWLWFSLEMAIIDVAGIVCDPNKTSRIIEHLPNDKTQEWTGYTRVSDIKANYEEIAVRLLPGGGTDGV